MKKKILVVDDEQAICNMLEKFLTNKEYRVMSVLSGEEVLQKIRKARPDVVLLDIRMPGMDGIEVLQRIRKLDKKLPIIMITAVKDDKVAKLCMELGASEYITKPISLEYLENVLTVKLLEIGK